MRALTEFQTDETKHDAPAPGPIWAKAASLAFADDVTAEGALSAAIANGLDHLAANESCVLGRFHPEGVHQMRVAVRRLRSRLAIYTDLVPDEQRRHANRELRWVIRQLGPARDWDVFLDEVLGPVIRSAADMEPSLTMLKAAATEQQDKAYERAAKAIRSKRYATIKAWLADWSLRRPWRDDGYPNDGWAVLVSPARDLAEVILQERHHEVIAHGQGMDEMTAEERHDLRINIKALRYAVEFFDRLYSNNAVRPYLGCLKELQDGLGQMNDLIVARELMAALVTQAKRPKRLDMSTAAGVVSGWHARGNGTEAGVAEPWKRFMNCDPFWA